LIDARAASVTGSRELREDRTAALRAAADELSALVFADGERRRDELRALVLALRDLALGPDGVPGPHASADHDDAARAAAWLGDAEVACTVAFDRALVARSQGRLTVARDVLDEALAAHPGSRIMRPWLEIAVAELARLAGRADEALERCERSAGMLADGRGFAPHALARAALLGVRTAAFLDLGQLERAVGAADEWERVARASGDVDTWLGYALGRANVLLAQRDFRGVLRFLDELDADAGLPELPPVRRAQLALRRGYAQAELEQRGPARAPVAAETLSAALEQDGLDAAERLRGTVFLCERRLADGRVDEAAAELERARALRRTLDTEAWSTPVSIEAELARLGARLALDRGAGDEELTRCARELESAFERYLEHFWNLAVQRDGTGFLHFARQRALLSEWIRLRVHRSPDGAPRALEDLFRAQALGSLARALGGSTTPDERSPQHVRHALAGRDGLLAVYLFAPERSHAFLVTPAGVRHAELASEHAIEPLVEALALRVARPPTELATAALAREIDAVRRLGAELGAELWPDAWRPSLAVDRPLVVVGSELVGLCLFECLPGLESGGWLGLDVALSYTPSAPLGVRLARRELGRDAAWPERWLSMPTPGRSDGSAELALERVPPLDAVVVAARTPAAEARARWPELEPLDVETDALAELGRPHGAGRSRFVGPDATLADLTSLDGSAAAVLHLVAHGVRDPDETGASLALGAPAGRTENGRFGLDEARAGAWPRLVVLTACGAGRGALRIGDDGPQRLGGALLGAGAATVVQSPFGLDLAASLAHGRALQRALARGASAAGAVLAGRRAVAGRERGGPGRWAHPYYWALPRAIGHAQASVLPHAPGLRRREERAADLERAKWVVVAGALVLTGLARLAWLRARARSGASR